MSQSMLNNARQKFIIRPYLESEDVKSTPENVRLLFSCTTISSKPNTFQTLRQSWAGRFYLNYLKQYQCIRSLSIWGWRAVFPLYVRLKVIKAHGHKEIKWRRLISLVEFSESLKITNTRLIDEVAAELEMAKVFPVQEQHLLKPEKSDNNISEVYVSKLHDATVYGGSNMVLVNELVVCHDLYDADRDETSEELHARSIVDGKTSRARWLLHDKEPVNVPVGASFLDACAGNYAHWMTEVLPRIVAFCEAEQFKNIPIFVNDGLHINIMESLLLVVDETHQIIVVPVGRALVVDELYVTSVTGYVPFGKKNKTLTGHSQGRFCRSALKKLSDKVVDVAHTNSQQISDNKIFIRRNSGVRKATNADELETIMIERGFIAIEPEKLTFKEQVSLFRNASEIVAPTGAALANAIFCKPGTKVVVLMGKHEDMIYKYWQNMLKPLSINVTYVLGELNEAQSLGIHADFLVERSDFINALDFTSS